MGTRKKSEIIFADTHIVVWLYQKKIDTLSDRARQIIEDNDIFISPMVVMELEYLFEIGKISESSKKIIEFLENAIALKIDDCSITEIIKVAINEKWTRDPFDRLIVSHAKLKNAILISADKNISSNYKKVVF